MRRPEFVARQSACPSGILGRLIGHVMARETAAVNEAALQILELKPTDHVLEVGFGHGATIARVAAAVSGGFVAGIDPSADMCRMAARRNRRTVEVGRVALREAVAEAIPYPDRSFDSALAVHTAYFWATLETPLAEIARVLKPGGRLVLVHRSDAGATQDFPASVYRFWAEDEIESGLARAQFVSGDVRRRAMGGASMSFHVARRRGGG